MKSFENPIPVFPSVSRIALVATIVLGGPACGPAFTWHGQTEVPSEYSPTAKATWTMPDCPAMNGSNEGASYKLVDHQGKPALLARFRNGDLALTTNYWLAPNGDHHFFTWITGSAMISVKGGSEYVIPKDLGPAAVLNYSDSNVNEEGGVSKPTGSPTSNCKMIPGG